MKMWLLEGVHSTSRGKIVKRLRLHGLGGLPVHRSGVSPLHRSCVSSFEKAEQSPGIGKPWGHPSSPKWLLVSAPSLLTKKGSFFEKLLLGLEGSEQQLKAQAPGSAASGLSPDSAPSALCHPDQPPP